MERIRYLFANDQLIGTSAYSDAVIVDLGIAYQIKFAGIAAFDPMTGDIVGYEAHNGSFVSDALELQVADIFSQLERLMLTASKELGKSVEIQNLTAVLVFLREDYPLVFQRFNDAYIDEFKKREISDYPARTTIMNIVIPEPNALVEIQFEAVVDK